MASHLHHTESGLKRAPVIVLPVDVHPHERPSAELFSGLSSDDIANLLAMGTLRSFAKGRIIVRSGEPAMHLFLIKTGLVNYYRVTPEGREVLLIQLSSGDTFGLGTLLDKPIRYIGTAETRQETEVHTWPRAVICRYVEAHPRLALNALRIGLEYIRLYSDRHLALVSDSAEDRLVRTLSLLGSRVGQPNPKGLEIQITNEHLASLADVGYFTASRLLNKWQHKGALEKSRGKVILHCPEKMLT